ncbi:MAG: CDP-alcohol phosphatidyltransferase family protein [Dinoroseobacter sp.]|nr:CDP-alcohol phosphatidyltransferase family protein [Dinoroseobacter sp.]
MYAHIPNILSLYRLAASPIALWMAFAGQREAFFMLIIVSLVSDLVDGPIARRIGRVSRFGAKADTVADAFTLIAGITGLVILEPQVFEGHYDWMVAFLMSYAAAACASLLKFGRLPAYHLYSSKTAAFGAGVFFVSLYLLGFSHAFFLGVLCLGILANSESLLVTLRLTRARTDIRSFFDLLRANDDGRA